MSVKKYIATLLIGSQLLSACTTEFLEVTPKGTNLEANYYRNQTEAFNGLVAAYDVVGWQGGGYVTKVGAMNAASDDHYAGGGGPNDISDFQVISNYTLTLTVVHRENYGEKGFLVSFVPIRSLPSSLAFQWTKP
jgi:hypothetical protein